MRRTLALATVLLLAGCGDPAGDGAANEAQPSDAPPSDTAAPAPDAGPAIGTTSNLTAQTSALTGRISDFRVTNTDFGTRVALAADTLFEFDKADLAPGAIENLQRVAALIREGGEGTITVTGHTDSKGDDAYNQSLSERRADAVATWLRTQPDLTHRRFAVAGKGESAPEVSNTLPDGGDSPDGRARNRRVEIDIPKG